MTAEERTEQQESQQVEELDELAALDARAGRATSTGSSGSKAEFDNYRKRGPADQESVAARAHERLVKELLPVLDDLERALDAADEHEEAKLEEGVRARPPRAPRRAREARASWRSRPTAASTRTSTRRCSRSPRPPRRGR